MHFLGAIMGEAAPPGENHVINDGGPYVPAFADALLASPFAAGPLPPGFGKWDVTSNKGFRHDLIHLFDKASPQRSGQVEPAE